MRTDHRERPVPAAETPRATVLVVDDDPSIRQVFVAALTRAGYRTVQADRGDAALEVLADTEVDVALLDLQLPGMSGTALIDAIRREPRHETLRIVLVSGDSAVDSKVAALAAGANDYLVKPVALSELLARVEAQLRDRSRWLAHLERQLGARAALARRITDLDTSLPLPELERELLAILSAKLPLRALAVIPNRDEPDDAAPLSVVTDDTGARIRLPLRFASAHVGILEVMVEPPAEAAVPALADLAPVVAVVVTESAARDGSAEDARRWVRTVVRDEAIAPVFQPIVELTDRNVVGYEGLTRFEDGTRPDVGFAIAAQHDLGPDLETAAMVRLLAASRELPTGPWLSLNVSAETVGSGRIDGIVNEEDRPLVIELTEHEHVDDYAHVRDRLAQLPGTRLAVDDAGAGYASLRHVFELRPELIKLDRTWVAEIDEDPVRQALITGMLGFSAAFGARLVAEGVEREQEAGTLRELGVPLAQGYLFGRPAPVDAVVAR